MPINNPREINLLNKTYLLKRFQARYRGLDNIDYNQYRFFLSKNLLPVEQDYLVFTPSQPDMPYLTAVEHKNRKMLDKVFSVNNKICSNTLYNDIKKECGIRNNTFAIMGIVNVTPDSFSDGGKYNTGSKAVEKALSLLDDGADIIDIGGESTRPGSAAVSEKEELERVIPVIKELKERKNDIIISVDTNKARVAEDAILAGADIINDISAFSFEPEIADVCAQYDKPLVLMHMKGVPRNMQKNPEYEDVVEEILNFFSEKTELLISKGVKKLILDPGIGFGKRVKDNYEIINRCGEFNIFGFPVLIGLSKKSYIGKSLNLEVDERENATVISEVEAVRNGAVLIRTHNVKYLEQARKLLTYYNDPELAADV